MQALAIESMTSLNDGWRTAGVDELAGGDVHASIVHVSARFLTAFGLFSGDNWLI
jgi:hypothetical protein